MRRSLRGSLTAALVTGVIGAFLAAGSGGLSPLALVIGPVLGAAGAAATFFILRRGKVNTARLVLFIAIGVFFTLAFSVEHQVNRGSILLTATQIEKAEVPICPITVPFVAPALALRGEMIFPASVQTLVGTAIMWLVFAILFGRGWCSWVCFFGWLDQAFATVLRRPQLRLERLHRLWRLFPYALLVFLILVSLASLNPVYCAWLCPLRIAYDPPAVNTTLDWVAALIFVVGGVALLIGGPLLTKKRLYCSLVCPLLPVNAIIGRISPFQVKVDRSTCVDCGVCIKRCESFAMTEDSLARGRPTMECTKCGRCMDACPKDSIDYCLIGTRVRVRPIFITLAVAGSLVMLATFVGTLVNYFLTGKISFLAG